MYKCMRKRIKTFNRSEKYNFQEHSQVMGEAGPVMQWWWIYTNSFVSKNPLLWLSAVLMTASVLCLIADSNSTNRIRTEAQHHEISLVLLNRALVPRRLCTFIILHR